MTVHYDEITIQTQGEVHIVDITSDVQKVISKSKITDGIVCVFVPGSTGTVTTIEYEPGMMHDVPEALEKIAPKNKYYQHHDRDLSVHFLPKLKSWLYSPFSWRYLAIWLFSL